MWDLRSNLSRLSDLCTEEDTRHNIASIVCFIIAPNNRRQGIASSILAYIIEHAKDIGYDIIEAYPSESDASHYHGPLRMYLSHGFVQVGEKDGYAIMRKEIG